MSRRGLANFIAENHGEKHRNEVLSVRHQRKQTVYRDDFMRKREHRGLRPQRLDQHLHAFLDETPLGRVHNRARRAAFR